MYDVNNFPTSNLVARTIDIHRVAIVKDHINNCYIVHNPDGPNFKIDSHTNDAIERELMNYRRGNTGYRQGYMMHVLEYQPYSYQSAVTEVKKQELTINKKLLLI